MKILKTIKYFVFFALFVVLTSFKPVDKFAKITGGESQFEVLLVND